MAKILSIEIGNSITRVSEMDFKVKNPKVYKYFSFQTPEGVLEDGFVQENSDFVIALKSALHENKIKTKLAIFSVTSTKIVTREVSVPSLKPAQLASYIKANANDYFPIDLTMYEIGHVVLGADPADETGSKQRVMVMAAGKDLITGYVQLANRCGLKLHSIDYAGNSVFQVMKAEVGGDATLVVRIEDNSTIASVIVGENLVLQRTLATGVDRAVRTVIDSPEYYESEYSAAFKQLCQKPIVKVVLSDRTRVLERDEATFENDHAEEARVKITATFTQLIGNLVRVTELYNSKDPLNPIRKVILTGVGAEVQNLQKLFHNELGITVETLRSVRSVGLSYGGDDKIGRYIGVFGAAISPVGLTTTESKAKEKKVVNYGLYTIVALLAVIVLLAGIFLKAYIPHQNEVKEQERLKAEEARYAEAEVVHKQFEAMQALYQDVENKYLLTEHPNDAMVEFFDELEKKLPSDVNIVSFTSYSEETSMIIHVSDYEEAAKVLQILRTFDSLRTVSINKIEAIKNDSSEEEEAVGGFDFEIICKYYPMGEALIKK